MHYYYYCIWGVGVGKNGEIANSQLSLKIGKEKKRASPNLQVIAPHSRPFHVGEVIAEILWIKEAEARLVPLHLFYTSPTDLFFMESYKLKQEKKREEQHF